MLPAKKLTGTDPARLVTRAMLPKVLTNVSTFTLNCTLNIRGGKTALYGPSGAGKTLFLHFLAGLERGQHDSYIRFDGEVWQNDQVFVPPHLRGVGCVFQESRLFPHLTVQGNLQYASRRKVLPIHLDIEEIASLTGIHHLLSRYPTHLSGGQCRRVALARTLLRAPRLLLLDEPLTGLDGESKWQLLSVLEEMQQRLAIPFLYISHDIREVILFADDLALIKEGKILAYGSLTEITTGGDIAALNSDDLFSVLYGTVLRYDALHQLNAIELIDGFTLFIAGASLQSMKRVRIPVLAQEVHISLAMVRQTSFLNTFPTTISAMIPLATMDTLLILQLGKQTLLSRVPNKICQQIRLSIGQRVYASLKNLQLFPL